MKIAYLEDDPDALKIFTRKFTADGITCQAFGSAEEALAAMGPGTHDLLVADVRLPGMSGIAFLAQLRGRHIEIPCILITAFNSLELAKEAVNTSANYLLEKPFTYQNLKKLILRLVSEPTSLKHCVDRGLALLELTERESDIARSLLKGLSNAEIARVSDLSEKTVKQHITQIFQKAGVSSRAEFFSSIFPV